MQFCPKLTFVQCYPHDDTIFGLGGVGQEVVVAHVGAGPGDARTGAQRSRATELGHLGHLGLARQRPHPQAGPHSQRQQAFLYLLQGRRATPNQQQQTGENGCGREWYLGLMKKRHHFLTSFSIVIIQEYCREQFQHTINALFMT